MTYTDFTYDLIAERGADFDSAAIQCVAYDHKTNDLFVEFISGGEYVYNDVAESTYNLFVGSGSLGRFYRDHIQGKFTGTKADCWLTDRRDAKPTTEVYEAASATGINIVDPDAITTDNAASMMRFSIRYTAGVDGILPQGPFEPEFFAYTEEAALAKFRGAFDELEALTGLKHDVKILAVTRYFD